MSMYRGRSKEFEVQKRYAKVELVRTRSIHRGKTFPTLVEEGDDCKANPIWTKRNCKKGTSGKCKTTEGKNKTCSKHKTCDENKCKVPDKKTKCKSITCEDGDDCTANPIWTPDNCKAGTANKCGNRAKNRTRRSNPKSGKTGVIKYDYVMTKDGDILRRWKRDAGTTADDAVFRRKGNSVQVKGNKSKHLFGRFCRNWIVINFETLLKKDSF